MYGNPEVTTGGRALKFYSSVRLDVRRVETISVGGAKVGNHTRVKVTKNKVAPPFREAEFDIIYGEGISRTSELVDAALKLDLIEKSGSWFTFREQRLQGKDSVKDYLKQNPDVADELEAEIKEKMAASLRPAEEREEGPSAAGRAVRIDADDFED